MDGLKVVTRFQHNMGNLRQLQRIRNIDDLSTVHAAKLARTDGKTTGHDLPTLAAAHVPIQV